MTDIEKAMDIAAERKRDADVDASFVVTDKDYPEPPPCIYDKPSWHPDCGQFTTSDNPDRNDDLRMMLKGVLEDIQRSPCSTKGLETMWHKYPAIDALRIGFMVIQNAIDNGLTVEMLGERTDETV